MELIALIFLACFAGAIYDMVHWAIWGRHDPIQKAKDKLHRRKY